MGDGLGPRVLVPKSVARIEPVRIRMPVGLAWRWIHGTMGQVNTELSCRCVTPDPVSSPRGQWTGKRIDNLPESNKVAVARCHMRRAARPGLEARRYGSQAGARGN